MGDLSILEPVSGWRAKWIWCDAEERPRNAYACFRRAFQLDAVPAAAPVRVSADTRFILRVNGQPVARGPSRSDRRWQSFDEVDLAPHLREGENVVAALVHHIGEPTAQTMVGRAGFLLEGEAGALRLDTGESWRGLMSQAWERDLPHRMLGQLDFWEVFDARKEPSGWAEPGFDDSAWPPAVVVGAPPCEPWSRMVPRDIPFMREDEVLRPVRVAQRGTFEAPRGAARSVAEAMAASRRRAAAEPQEKPRPHRRPRQPDEVTLGAGEYVVLDFGIEVTGYLELTVSQADAGAALDIGYGERLAPNGAVDPSRGECHYADRLICRSGAQTWGPFEKRAFRYVMLDCVGPGGVTLDEVGLRLSVYPAQWRESFASPDPRLRDIWRLSTYTLQLNMEDAYTDCPWRERGQWVGDARVEALANYYAFGDTRLARRWLFQAAQSQDDAGRIKAFSPTDLETYIPGFMCLWICGIADYGWFSGDLEAARRLWPAARNTLSYFEGFEDSDGLLADLPGWMFIDWSPMEVEGVSTGLNALYVMALDAAAQIAEWCGEEAGAWRQRAERVRASADRLLWDEALGAYRDSRRNGPLSRSAGQAANALCVVAGIAGERAGRVLDTILDPARLLPVFEFEQMPCVDFAACDGKIIPVGSPYMSFYLLQALWREGRAQEALDYIRAKWGAMLVEGDTAAREFWKHSPITSHAHGFSAAPTHDLAAHVLGARPAAPGWSEAVVEPHLCDLEWARGEIPTPHGVMRLRCRRTDKGTEVEVDAPEGMSVAVTGMGH